MPFVDPITVMSHAVVTGRLPSFAAMQSAIAALGPWWWEPRDTYGRSFGYGIPCAETVRRLADYGPLLEVGCGHGFWTWWLRRCGVDVVATDPLLHDIPWVPDIIPIDAETTMDLYPDRHLLMVWPRFDATWPARLLRRLRPRTSVCYVGDAPGGCCGDAAFFEELHSTRFRFKEGHLSPCWPLTHDYLTVYERV
jgi:hypothetical protein